MVGRRRAGAGTWVALALFLVGAGCRAPSLGDVDLGRELATEIRRVHPVVREPAVRAYLITVARPLLDAAGPHPFSYRIFVLDEPTPNAFALPGGYLFVHSGALLSARSTAEIAALLAHEIGHVVRRHAISARDEAWVQAYRHEAARSRRALHGLVISPEQAALHQQMSTALFLSHFSQKLEMEADRFAVETLHEAGLCGLALADVFERWAGSRFSAPAVYLATHPPYASRIHAIREQVARLGPCDVEATASDDPLLGIQELLGSRGSLD